MNSRNWRHSRRGSYTAILGGLTLLICMICFVSSCATDPVRSKSAPEPKGPFRTQYVPHLQESEIVVKNRSGNNLTLTFSGTTSKTMWISPHSIKRIKIPAGTYNYEAIAPGIAPISGKLTFDKHHRYTWTFMISRELL